MLIKGNTPQNEPLISVGLVLPEDKQKSILITSSQTKNLLIKVYKSGISINGKSVQGDYILKSKNNQVFNLDQVSAGRGFHWSKKISLSTLKKKYPHMKSRQELFYFMSKKASFLLASLYTEEVCI